MAQNVHFLRLSDDWNAAEMELFLPLISPERQTRIQRLRVAADRKATLFAGLLTRLVVSSELGISQHALQFTRGTYGKPAGADSTTSELLALPHPKNGGTSLRCCADWCGCRGTGAKYFRLGESGGAPLYAGGKSAAAKQPGSGKMLFDDLDGERGICQTVGNRAAHAV